ncbi:hypothetical protein Tco_0067118 [Tanacetum coccineum]
MRCHQWRVHGDDVAKAVFRLRNGHVEVYGYAFWVNQCTSDDRGVTEGREDVREVFQQCRSRAKRKLSKCGRNQMGNEPILALPKGAEEFVVYYDARNKDLEACLEKRIRFVLVFVEAAKHQIVDSERDRLIVVDRGTRSVPLFVMLSVTVSTWFGVFACEHHEDVKTKRSG